MADTTMNTDEVQQNVINTFVAGLSEEVLNRSKGDLLSQEMITQYVAQMMQQTEADLQRYLDFAENYEGDRSSLIAEVSNIRTSLINLYQGLQDSLAVYTETNDTRYNKLVSDVARYIQLLSDITLDSTNITLDNGEIRYGAWTILSQARQWDLDILAKFNEFKSSTLAAVTVEVDGLKDLVRSDEETLSIIISELGNTPIFKNLDQKLNTSLQNIDNLQTQLVDAVTSQAQALVTNAAQIREETLVLVGQVEDSLVTEMDTRTSEINLLHGFITESVEEVNNLVADTRSDLENQITQETQQRVDALIQEAVDRTAAIEAYATVIQQQIVDEANTRIEAISQEVQNRTSAINAETQARIAAITELEDGFNSSIELIQQDNATTLAALNNYKTSNDSALANVSNQVNANVSDIAGNASSIEALDVRLSANEGTSATALSKAELALTENTAQGNQINAINLSLNDKADASALTTLEAEVEDIDGRVVINTNALTALTSSLSEVDEKVATKLDASVIENYYTKVETDNVLAGSIAEYDSNLIIGSVNQLINSEAERTTDGSSYMEYERSQFLHNFYQMQLGKLVTVSFDAYVNTPGLLNVFAANMSAHSFMALCKVATAEQWVRVSVTARVGINENVDPSYLISSLEFKGVTPGLVPKVRRVKLEAGSRATDWSPSPRDFDASITSLNDRIEANANALTEVITRVDNVDGELTSISSSLLALSGEISEVDTKAGTALNNAATAQQTANTAVNKADVNAAAITDLSASMGFIEEELDTKASADGVSALTIRVTNVEDEVTSQGSLLTSLSGDLQQVTTDLDTKASSEAVSLLDTKVTAIDGKVSTNSSDITTLTNSLSSMNTTLGDKIQGNVEAIQGITTELVNIDNELVSQSNAITSLTNDLAVVEDTLTTKADSSAVSSLTSQVGTIEGVLTNYGTQLTTLSNDLDQVNTDLNTKASTEALNALDSRVTAVDDKVTLNTSDISSLNAELDSVNTALGTAIQSNASAIQGINTEIESIGSTLVTQSNSITDLTNSLSTVSDGLETKADNAALTALTSRMESAEGDLTTSLSDITQLKNSVTSINGALETKASNEAFNTLSSELDIIDGKVSSNTDSITSLTNSLSSLSTAVESKADAAALTSLSNTVTELDGEVSANSSSILSLSGRITTTEEELETKADTSLLNSYYTKTETDEAVSGSLSEYKASLLLGGVNQLYNTEGIRTTDGSSYLGYERSKALYDFYEDNLNKPITISFDVKANKAGLINVFAANLSAHSFMGMVQVTEPTEWTRLYVSLNVKASPGYNSDVLVSALEFKGITAGMVLQLRRVQLEAGNVATAWAPSPRDYRNALEELHTTVEANATAIDNTNASVSVLDGALTSLSTSVQTLEANLVTVDEKAGTGIANAASAQQTANAAVTANEVTADRVDTLEVSYNQVVQDVSTKASITALDSLTTQVTANTEGLVSQGNSITQLQDEIETVSSVVSTKASADALSTLTTQVRALEDENVTQSNSITSLTNSLSTVSLDVVSAQQAATDALTAANAKGRVIFGATEPVAVERLPQNLWIDTTGGTNTPKRWDGNAWVAVTDKAALDALDAANNALDQLTTKADASALTALASTVSDIDDQVSSNSSAITTLTNSVDSFNSALATKADSNALSALTSTVEAYGNTLTTHGNSITSLQSSMEGVDTALASKASAEALSSLDTKVTGIDENYTAISEGLIVIGTAVEENTATLAVQGQSINGVLAEYTIKTDVNGRVAGVGLINDGQSAAFGVNADFYVGSADKKPFVVLESAQTLNGVEYPAGVWIDAAFIANATIGGAKIADASIESAQIKDGAITSAKIGTLDASKITSGTIDADRIGAESITADKIDASVFTSVGTDGSSSYISGGTFRAYYPNGNIAFHIGVS